MSAMFGGSSQSNYSNTPFTAAPGSAAAAAPGSPLATLMPSLTSGIADLTSGSAYAPVTKQTQQVLQTGIQQYKSAMAGAGMGQSTVMGAGINQMTQQAYTNLAATMVAGIQSGIEDIINMSSGTGHQWGSTFGWNAGASLSYTSPGGAVNVG